MTYAIVQTRRFARAYKRLHANVAAEVDDAVVSIAADPQVGDRKNSASAESGGEYIDGIDRQRQRHEAIFLGSWSLALANPDRRSMQIKLTESRPGVSRLRS